MRSSPLAMFAVLAVVVLTGCGETTPPTSAPPRELEQTQAADGTNSGGTPSAEQRERLTTSAYRFAVASEKIAAQLVFGQETGLAAYDAVCASGKGSSTDLLALQERCRAIATVMREAVAVNACTSIVIKRDREVCVKEHFVAMNKSATAVVAASRALVGEFAPGDCHEAFVIIADEDGRRLRAINGVSAALVANDTAAYERALRILKNASETSPETAATFREQFKSCTPAKKAKKKSKK